MNHKIRKIAGLTLIFIIVFINLLSSLSVLAEGDGSGGGQSEPLCLVSSSPESGQKDVGADTEINLVFSKNVINMTVKDDNMKCFAFFTAAGVSVPVKVVMADDQMQPELKRVITIVPEKPLLQGTEYILKIAPELRAKSGALLGSEVNVVFTTAGTKTEETNKITTVTSETTAGKAVTSNSKTVTGTNITPTSSKSVEVQSTQAGDKATETVGISVNDARNISNSSVAGNVTSQSEDIEKTAETVSPNNNENNIEAAVKSNSNSLAAVYVIAAVLAVIAVAVYIYLLNSRKRK